MITKFRQLWRDRRGVSSIVLAVSAMSILGTAGIAIDVGLAYAAKQQLVASTQAAALSAAYTWASTGSESSARTAGESWHTAHAVPMVTGVTATASTSCVTATAANGLPNCTSTAPNVISVKQVATAKAYLFPVFGINNFSISATTMVSKAGGSSQPLNIVFILDATGSMSNTDGTGCTVPGITSPTKFQCAMYGVQLVLKQLVTPQDQVELLVFPPMNKTFVPCATSYPSTVKYWSTGAIYQIASTSFDTGYKAGASTLSVTNPIVKAVGNNATSLAGCLQNKGGVGTYYAEVLKVAQTKLAALGNNNAQNVIIFLSDGAANADSSGMDSVYYNQTKYAQNQCAAGVQAADAATAAGTWVYSIANEAATTNSSSGCPTPDTYTPCTAMQAIASDNSKFFSTSSTCVISGSPNTFTSLSSAFQQIAVTLFKPRIISSL